MSNLNPWGGDGHDSARAHQRAQQNKSVEQERAADAQYNPNGMARLYNPDTEEARFSAQPPSGVNKPWIKRPWPIAIALCALLFVVGHVHILTGNSIDRTVLLKVSWSLSETIVNTDALMKMPGIAARSHYPLTLLALQRANLIENDTERQDRVARELRASAERFQRDLEVNSK